MKNKEYLFLFKRGGFDTVWARTLPSAREKAITLYKDQPNDLVLVETVRLASPNMIKELESTSFRRFNSTI